MKKFVLFALSLFLASGVVLGEEIITISGRVIDINNDRMARVNVRTEGSSIATVTNGDGEFLLKLPLLSVDDSVRFSFVGCINEVLSVRDIVSRKGGAIVRLSPEDLTITRIDVDLKNATSYVEEAFRRIDENYLKERSYQRAFYRETIKKRYAFATLAEAVVEVEKSGLKSLQSDRAAISKARSLRDCRFTDTLFVRFRGGIVSSLFLDVAKYRDIVFPDNLDDEYRFWFEKPTTIDGRRVMVVAFNQRSEDPEVIKYRGSLYIDSLDMAIARAEFNLNVEGREDAISIFVKKKPKDVKMEATEVKYISSYRLLDGVWRFDYSSTELALRCHFPKRLFRNNYTITSEIVITEHDVEPKRIPYSSSVRTNDFMFDSAQEFHDEDFWESYNVIEHERSIDAVVRRFLRQLKER